MHSLYHHNFQGSDPPMALIIGSERDEEKFRRATALVLRKNHVLSGVK